VTAGCYVGRRLVGASIFRPILRQVPEGLRWLGKYADALPCGLCMLRILIADDHEVVRSGLRLLLEARSGWTVVGEAENGKDAVQKAIELRPHVAILDYGLPLVNGIDATRELRALVPSVEILIFTMHESEALIRAIFAAGARGYLLKSHAKHDLCAAIETVAQRQPFFSGSISTTLLRSYLATERADSDPLTRQAHRPTDRRRQDQQGNEVRVSEARSRRRNSYFVRLRSPPSTVPAGIIVPTFPQRSPPRPLAAAACGGLGSAPDRRTRRALLHLSNSCASPCGPAMLVTHDPLRTWATCAYCGAAFLLEYPWKLASWPRCDCS
jgi:DNA-binding NarL/FixJ family response regulator